MMPAGRRREHRQGRVQHSFHPIIHPFIAIRAEMLLMTLGAGVCWASRGALPRISRVRPAERECQCSANVQRNVA